LRAQRRRREERSLDTPERRASALEELDARIELLEFEVGLLVSRRRQRERQPEKPAEPFESMIERLKALRPR